MNNKARRDKLIGGAIASGRIPIEQAGKWANEFDAAPAVVERTLAKNPEVTGEEMRELFPGRCG